MNGLIVKAISGFYYVQTDAGVIECKARGKFRSDGISPLVGDRVEITADGDAGRIDRVLPRKNALFRPPLANVDKLFIVSASKLPSPDPLLIDRLTAICAYNEIEPVILFNKQDVKDVSEWCRIYRHAGFQTVACSAETGEGADTIREELRDCVSAFTGNSGAGKSSLLNLLFPSLHLSTGEVSDKLGRGRHTTRHCELFAHEYAGYVADTPGFSALEADRDDLAFKEALPACFADFERFRYDCRFRDCTHTGEKGCAVCEALKRGEIEKTRYASYLTLHDELKDLKHWHIKK